MGKKADLASALARELFDDRQDQVRRDTCWIRVRARMVGYHRRNINRQLMEVGLPELKYLSGDLDSPPWRLGDKSVPLVQWLSAEFVVPTTGRGFFGSLDDVTDIPARKDVKPPENATLVWWYE